MIRIYRALREVKTCAKCGAKNNVSNRTCVGCGTAL